MTRNSEAMKGRNGKFIFKKTQEKKESGIESQSILGKKYFLCIGEKEGDFSNI